MSVINAYLHKLPESQRTLLGGLCDIVRATVPSATETISYGMPVFKYQGAYLIGLCGFKHHMSVFPGSEVIAEIPQLLAPFKTAKGTIQFTEDHPIDAKLLREILTRRVRHIEAGKAAK